MLIIKRIKKRHYMSGTFDSVLQAGILIGGYKLVVFALGL
jgi:hypothetical protein